jgi:hypothetical protein
MPLAPGPSCEGSMSSLSISSLGSLCPQPISPAQLPLGGSSAMVTADNIRTFALSLPRTEEALVRDQVKFRVGRIVYVALSRDERSMGFGFPRTSAPRWSPPGQRSSSCRLHPTCVTTGYGCGWIDTAEMRDPVVDAWHMVVPKRTAADYLRDHP